MLAAGGTGGHLFPAEALGVALIKRGAKVRLMTDSRALRYGGMFTRDMMDVVPSETVRGRTPWALARTGAMLAAGGAKALASTSARTRPRVRRLAPMVARSTPIPMATAFRISTIAAPVLRQA